MFANSNFRLSYRAFALLQRSLPQCASTKHQLKTQYQAFFNRHQSLKTNFLITHSSDRQAGTLSKMHDHRADDGSGTINTRSIFLDAVEAVLPRQMLQTVVRYSAEHSMLLVEDRQYHLAHNVHVVGFGKAVCGMARVVEDIIGEHIRSGIISIPLGAVEDLTRADRVDMLLKAGSKIEIFEGARNNLPDENSLKAATEIYSLVSSLGETDIVIVLVSGGGSALLPMPCPPVSLTDMMHLTKLLSQHGANINELNCVRRNIEELKGGGLAKAAEPAQVITLIVSDAIGNSLDVIASGPTVPNCSHPSQCLEIFNRLGIMDDVPQSVIAHLETNITKTKNSSFRDTKQIFSSGWDWVYNIIVGSNIIATAAAAKRSEALGYTTFLLSNSVDGEAKEVAAMFAKLACFISLVVKRASKEYMAQLRGLELELVDAGIKKTTLNEVVNICEKAKNSGKSVCIISGGETTVQVKGSGIGGRNQEMVLAAAIYLDELFTNHSVAEKQNVLFFSGGTDGQDGMTNAAGAIIDANFAAQAKMDNLCLKAYLDNNDSHSLFKKVKDGSSLVKTGLTGTNVMDIQILMVKV